MTQKPNKPVIITADDLEGRTGTIYPTPYAQGFDGRIKKALTSLLGLTQFGVNIVTLEPDCVTSQRHWHENEDEFVYVIDGEVILETDAGETIMTAGMATGFPAGVPDGHRIINRSGKPATILEVGTRAKTDKVTYSDIDMKAEKSETGQWRFLYKDGKPYST